MSKTQAYIAMRKRHGKAIADIYYPESGLDLALKFLSFKWALIWKGV